MHVAIITAGGAGMFCGSCMHDNTWARALIDHGAEATLIPTYTPIRVDDDDVSVSDVFLGGINVYLDYRLSWWRKLPRWMNRWLDSPRLINWVSKVGVSNDAAKLGALTLAMLDGEAGPLSREIEELASYITQELRPDAIVFSNALLIGSLRRIREQFTGPIFCTLQGDDIFLDDLPEPYRIKALEKMHDRAEDFDGFFVHSDYYRDYMSGYLKIPLERFHKIPLGIDLHPHTGEPRTSPGDPFTVGYFARICPEKGLHRLVEGFRLFHEKHPNTRLVWGGYLGKRDKKYARSVQKAAKNLGDAFHYAGSPDKVSDKVALLNSFDVLSVPTEYHEPKGLSILESLANGVPVVQPAHGAFPELLRNTEGGLLVPPDDPQELANALERMLTDRESYQTFATNGRERVRELYSGAALARESLRILSTHSRKPAEVPPAPEEHAVPSDNA